MSETISPAHVSPSVEFLCLSLPLYSTIALQVEDRELLATLRIRNFQIDAHCIKCGRESIFKTDRSVSGGAGGSTSPPGEDWQFRSSRIDVDLSCQRCNQQYYYKFVVRDLTLQKIGQFPSMEDIAGADLNRFRKILAPQDFSELHRAGGLASHGIGIGSFVYLRRIFERLIVNAKAEVIALGNPLEGFDGMRMDEKIGALHSVLPPALVKNKAAYAILSVGLHQLDEKTCLQHFPVVRAAIIQMLEQHLSDKTKKDVERALELEIQKISGSLKGHPPATQKL